MIKSPKSSKQLCKIGLKKSDFDFGPLIGEGGLGLVFKAKQVSNGEEVAIKAMKKK